MSLHAIVGSQVRQALSLLATPGLSYRDGVQGAWVALSGSKFQAGQPQIIGFDEAHNAIVAPMTASLRVPDTGQALKVLAGECVWQIQEADGTVWSIVGGPSRHNGQTLYSLTRASALTWGKPRGDVPS